MKFLWMLYILSIFSWANIGNIATLIGGVKILRENSVIQASSGMALQQKDKIKTEKKSRVQIILKDDTVVTIGANSLFSFDKYRFTGDKQSEAKMRIERGFFRSVTGRIGKIAPERFKVKTLSATIGIRGTDFAVRILEKKEEILCYRGQISVHFGNFIQNVDEGMMVDFALGVANTPSNPPKPKVIPKKKGEKAKSQIAKETSSNLAPPALSDIADAIQQADFLDIERPICPPLVTD